MVTKSTTLHQIRQMGLAALARELGPYGLVRFLQQYEGGSGNYTQERSNWLGDLSVDEIADEIDGLRKAGAIPVKVKSGRRKAAA